MEASTQGAVLNLITTGDANSCPRKTQQDRYELKLRYQWIHKGGHCPKLLVDSFGACPIDHCFFWMGGKKTPTRFVQGILRIPVVGRGKIAMIVPAKEILSRCKASARHFNEVLGALEVGVLKPQLNPIIKSQ